MKLKLEKAKCIGCGSCVALCSKIFELDEDGKSHLKGAEKKEVEEIELPESGCAQDAAEACPGQCIYLTK